jgi:tetratricopeptide (TPR) repeat protein
MKSPTTSSTPRAAPGAPLPARRGGRKKALIAAGCLLVAAAAGCFFAAPQIDAWSHWRQARRALEDCDFGPARAHLARCLEVWPNSAETHFVAAQTLRRANAYDDAAARLREAERLGWPAAAVELEQLLARAQAGNTRPLEEAFNRPRDLRPEDERLVREALAAGHLQEHFLDRAHQVTSRWTREHPEDWLGHYWHGRVLESGLQYELAATAYEHALGLRPGRTDTHWRCGAVLLRRGRHAEAAAHFEQCLRADPGHAGARLGLARCQRFTSSPQTALATLQPLLDAQPDYPGACLLRGLLAADADEPEQALSWLRRAAAQAPNEPEVNHALALALRRLGRGDEARAYEEKQKQVAQDYKRMEQITKEVAQNPADASPRREAGKILMRLGQDREAAGWLISALALQPRDQPTRQALAECVARLGDPRLTEYSRRLLGQGGKE